MPSHSEHPESTPPLQRGVYQAPLATDLRGPCPIINALANHGYIPRNGRNVSRAEMRTAVGELGVSSTLSTALAYGAYLEHQAHPPTGFWAFIRNPFAYILRHFGLRDPNQRDPSGASCLNLDQLARHNAVEHDVSLSRRDAAQGDNSTPQKDLIAGLVQSASDGKEITTGDFARFRRQRLEQQKRDNSELTYGPLQHQLACAESAFLQTLFGVGRNVPVPYLKALFEEERLPVREGWKKRWWWPVGFIELNAQAEVLKKCIGKID